MTGRNELPGLHSRRGFRDPTSRPFSPIVTIRTDLCSGGKGKGKGNKQPVSPTGVHAKGTRTRRPKDKGGNKMVVVERPRGVKSEAKGGRA